MNGYFELPWRADIMPSTSKLYETTPCSDSTKAVQALWNTAVVECIVEAYCGLLVGIQRTPAAELCYSLWPTVEGAGNLEQHVCSALYARLCTLPVFLSKSGAFVSISEGYVPSSELSAEVGAFAVRTARRRAVYPCVIPAVHRFVICAGRAIRYLQLAIRSVRPIATLQATGRQAA